MLELIKDCIDNEIEQVSQSITLATQSNLKIINSIGEYAVNQSGRKMIRPTILILLAKALGSSSACAIKLAAIIELIHSATLLHDDVIDGAKVRRSKPSAHRVFGGTQSILMGDFIYASAFKLIAGLDNPEITQILALATQEIVEGEIQQLSLQHNIETTLAQYFQIIRAKTALLFSTGAQCIGTLSKDKRYTQAIHDYGYHFGMLYQITDDILDIDVNNTQLNKDHGVDLSEGKMTLPTILAYRHASNNDKTTIYNVVTGQLPWQEILPVYERAQALKLCDTYKEKHHTAALKALESLPESIYKQHLANLISEIPNRKR